MFRGGPTACKIINEIIFTRDYLHYVNGNKIDSEYLNVLTSLIPLDLPEISSLLMSFHIFNKKINSISELTNNKSLLDSSF